MALRLSILVDSKADTTGFKEADTGMKALNNNLKSLQAGFGAIVGAAATFKQAFELSREGASVIQLRTSFERMNREVYKTPGLMDAMKEATRGTVGEGTLMASMLTLTAGASDQVSQAMAAAAPQLAQIAKAASALNPTLGDTSMMFDSLGLGIKRQSPMILDNLGLTIRIGEANEAMAAKLGKSVEQLTAEEKQMALLNEVLRAGGTLIEQAGGSVDSATDAWDRMTVKITEGTNALKVWLAEGLEPVISAAGGSYGDEIDGMIASNIEQAQSVEDLQAEYGKLQEALNLYGGMGALITGTQDDLKDGQIAIIEQLAASSESSEDFIANLKEMGIVMDQQGTKTSAYYLEIYREVEAHEENDAALARENERRAAATAHLQESTDATETYIDRLRNANRVLVEHGVSLNASTVPADELYYTTTELADATTDFGDVIDENRAKIEQRNQLWAQAGTAIEPLLQGYRDAEAATGRMIQVDGQWMTDHDAAALAITTANAGIATSYKQMAADAILAEQGINAETLNLLVTMGLLTQQEADAKMEFMNNSDIINNVLIPAYKSGRLSAEELDTAIDLLADGTANSGEQAIQMATAYNNQTTPALTGAKTEAVLLKDELLILSEMNVEPGFTAPDLSGTISQAERLRQLLSDLENQGSGGGYGGVQNLDGGATPGGGNIPEYASGTSFHPGGLAIVGERGQELVSLPRGSSVANANDTKKMLSGGGQTIVQVGPIYALSPAIGNPAVLGAEIARNIGSKMIGG